MTIHDRIDQLDLDLFRTIDGQTSPDDRRSFLALQSAFRQWKKSGFTLLEIGSYEGGSLQAYVADPACARIVSIDPRPRLTRDERGASFDYSHVTAAQMLERLGAVPGADIEKVRTITAGTDTVRPADLGLHPDVCFIDGEHTDEAALRDAQFCLDAAGPDCVLVFHDANVVYNALHRVIGDLEAQGRQFRAYNLPSVVFVIELGNCRLSEIEPLRSWRRDNYKGYLESLMRNDPFREIGRRHDRVLRHPLVGIARAMGLVTIARRLFGLR